MLLNLIGHINASAPKTVIEVVTKVYINSHASLEKYIMKVHCFPMKSVRIESYGVHKKQMVLGR